MKMAKQFTDAELRENNWWTNGARFRGGMEVVGVDPQGMLISEFPEEMPLPQEFWVTSIGIVVDRCVFLGWGLSIQTNFQRLTSWLPAWAAEKTESRPVVCELVEELEYRVKHLEEDDDTRESRCFLL